MKVLRAGCIVFVLSMICACVNPSAHHNTLGREYLEKGQLDEAIRNFKIAAELNPHVNYLDWLGMAYMQNRQWAEGLEVYKKAIELKPDDPRFFNAVSRCSNEIGNYDEAITAAKRAISLQPDFAYPYANLGAAYFSKKQFDEALSAYRKAIELEPEDATFYFKLGHFFLERKAYDRAAENYTKAVELAPNDIGSLLSLADIYRHMGKYDDALALIDKAIERQTITGVGINIFTEEDYPVVKEVFETGPAKKAGLEAGDKIIEVDGNSTEGWRIEQVAQSLRGASGAQVAITIERKGIDKSIEKRFTREKFHVKDAAYSFGLRSLLVRHKRNHAQALQDAKKAISLDSANYRARLSLGAVYLDSGRYDEACLLLQKIQDNAMARILEATAYARQKDFKKAVAIYRTVLEEDDFFSASISRSEDQNAFFLELKPYLSERRAAARKNEGTGEYKSALTALSEAITVADDVDRKELRAELLQLMRRMPSTPELPEDARKHVLRGEVMIRNGEFEPAVKEFKTAIKIAPYVAKLYFNTALLHADMKKYPEAIRYMNTYIEMAPDAPDTRLAKDEIVKWEYLMGNGK